MTNKNRARYVAAIQVVAGLVVGAVGWRLLESAWWSGDRDPMTQTRYVISRLIREFHSHAPNGLADAYEDAVHGQPRLLSDNPTNQGAELLYMVAGTVIPWSSDTDGDGYTEAADALGEPLIFLTKERPVDYLIGRNGLVEEVGIPPFFGDGFYLSSLSLHVWFSGDRAALSTPIQDLGD